MTDKIQTPATHRNDPITSHIAEAQINKGKRFTNQQTIAGMVKLHPGKTAAELGELTGLGQHECARRLSEINGVSVERSGRRKCTVKGTPMMVWIELIDECNGAWYKPDTTEKT